MSRDHDKVKKRKRAKKRLKRIKEKLKLQQKSTPQVSPTH